MGRIGLHKPVQVMIWPRKESSSRARKAMMKAEIWFFAMLEMKTPMAMAADPMQSTPRYSPTISPASSLPKSEIMSGKGKVSASIIASSSKEERYLARTIDHSENGRVVKSSMVPILRSSAQLRMVMAGTRKMNTTGMLTKKPRSEASFCAKKCRKRKSHPEVMMRKAMTTMYAIGEVKKERSSFFMMGSIEFTP